MCVCVCGWVCVCVATSVAAAELWHPGLHGVAAGAAAVLGVDVEAGAVGAVVRVGHREAARGRSAGVRGASGVSVARELGRLVLQLAKVQSQSGSFAGAPGRPRAPSARRMQNRRQKRVCVTRTPGAHAWDSADSAESGNNIGSMRWRLGVFRNRA